MNTYIQYNEEARLYHEKLKSENRILFEGIVGSTAYGTNHENSDIDKVFVYIENTDNVLTGNYSYQLCVSKDYVGYEIGRLIDLIGENNPNILDLINPHESTIIYMHPLYKQLIVDNYKSFITTRIYYSYGGYANTQIAKARGLNKKVANPMVERKDILDFCFAPAELTGKKNLFSFFKKPVFNANPINIKDYLTLKNIKMSNCGIASISHMKNTFYLFHDKTGKKKYRGIADKKFVQLVLSSIPKNEVPLTTFYCNFEAFSSHCKKYREYNDWLVKRNEHRYNKFVEVGKGYDTKNLAHCHRLLDMCIEIFTKNEINVRRSDKEIAELKAILNGEKEFEDLLKDAQEKFDKIEVLHAQSSLPEQVDFNFIFDLLLEFRKSFF